MVLRATRVLLAIAAVGGVLWLARLKAHAKVPPPEGRWRDIPHDAFP